MYPRKVQFEHEKFSENRSKQTEIENTARDTEYRTCPKKKERKKELRIKRKIMGKKSNMITIP